MNGFDIRLDLFRQIAQAVFARVEQFVAQSAGIIERYEGRADGVVLRFEIGGGRAQIGRFILRLVRIIKRFDLNDFDITENISENRVITPL